MPTYRSEYCKNCIAANKGKCVVSTCSGPLIILSASLTDDENVRRKYYEMSAQMFDEDFPEEKQS